MRMWSAFLTRARTSRHASSNVLGASGVPRGNRSVGAANSAQLFLQKIPRTADVRFSRVQVSNRKPEGIPAVEARVGDEDFAASVHGLENASVQNIRVFIRHRGSRAEANDAEWN